MQLKLVVRLIRGEIYIAAPSKSVSWFDGEDDSDDSQIEVFRYVTRRRRRQKKIAHGIRVSPLNGGFFDECVHALRSVNILADKLISLPRQRESFSDVAAVAAHARTRLHIRIADT